MNDDLHSLAAAYALDALDEMERHRFETHMETCAACRTEVDEFREIAASFTAEDMEPSVELRGSTLDLIAKTPQTARRPGTGAEDLGPVVEPARSTESPEQAIGGSGSRNEWSSRQWLLGAAAALLVFVALAVVAVMATRTSGTDSTNEVAAVLDAPDAVHTAMLGEDGATASSDLEVVHSAQHDGAVVVGDAVPIPEPGHVYQLWGITPDGAVSAGLFEPTDDGTVEVPVSAPEGTSGWAVTVEPTGGSAVATTDPVFISGDA